MSPGKGLARRRAPQQQRELAVGLRLLGQVVVDDQRVPAAVAEVLGHGAAGVGGEELHRRGIGGRGGDDRRVVHRAVLLERLVDLHHGGALLADGHVEAHDVLAALVDDRVDRHAGLAGLAVADDQLALAAADRRERVDHLDAGLQRLLDVLAVDDARRLDLDRRGSPGLDRRAAVDRVAERVHDAADERLADGDGGDALGAPDLVAFADARVLAEDRHADVVLLEVQHHAHRPAGELDQFAGHDVRKAVDARDAVADAQHRADLVGFRFRLELGQLLFQDRGDFFGLDINGHGSSRGDDLLFKGFELVRGAGVVNHVADLHREPAEQGGVGLPFPPQSAS